MKKLEITFSFKKLPGEKQQAPAVALFGSVQDALDDETCRVWFEYAEEERGIMGLINGCKIEVGGVRMTGLPHMTYECFREQLESARGSIERAMGVA